MKLLSAAVCTLLLSVALAAAEKFDVVVYRGTAGGVTAAVSSAREGLSVALLEPRNHLGGMVSGGLSRTDYGKREVIGGMALEFYWRAGRHYQMQRHGQELAWLPEPSVAENIFKRMAKEAGVKVFYQHRLREKTGVKKNGARIQEIVMENGASFEAKIFVDASYEGDLMAQAGVSYTWGRESAAQYDESLAGVRGETPKHQFTVKVSAYDESGKLLPEIQSRPMGAPGAADKKVQAYNFRMCLSSDPANQTPFPKPKNYDPRRYELLARLLKARAEAEGRAPRLGTVIKIDPIPNNKADINNNGAFSTDYLGGSWDYPEADYAARERIWQAHVDYVAGFFYFLANDARVPQPLQDEMRQWGLARDEFTDTSLWPHQLYIREARRMVGEYVMAQKDLQTELTKPDAIGMGSYNSDSHNVTRIATKDGHAMNEGDMQVPVAPYQIPYRVMLPKRGEARNLLVPVCFSASHVAYSSLRMEPQYMMMGQAAGVAAMMAIQGNVAVQEIDARALTRKLREQGAVLEYAPSPHMPIFRLFQEKFARTVGN